MAALNCAAVTALFEPEIACPFLVKPQSAAVVLLLKKTRSRELCISILLQSLNPIHAFWASAFDMQKASEVPSSIASILPGQAVPVTHFEQRYELSFLPRPDQNGGGFYSTSDEI